jgi:hypothetical protein
MSASATHGPREAPTPCQPRRDDAPTTATRTIMNNVPSGRCGLRTRPATMPAGTSTLATNAALVPMSKPMTAETIPA